MHNTITELRELAARIEARRNELALSKNELCRKFGQLGSTKTYSRILNPADDLAEGIDPAAQLANYRAAWELLGDWKAGEENKIYADFEFVREGHRIIREALEMTDNTRFVLVLADQGGGKTSFLETLENAPGFANILYRVEATEAWRERPNPLLGKLLSEVGLFDRAPRAAGETGRRAEPPPLPPSPDAREIKLIERIAGRRIILVIDEGHHIGPAGLNVLKSLINQSRAVIIMAALPALIARLNKRGHIECSQLFGNRRYATIRIDSPEAGDILTFLQRRGVKFATAEAASQIAGKIAADAVTNGLWKYVSRCALEARRSAVERFDAAAFAKIISAVKARISLG